MDLSPAAAVSLLVLVLVVAALAACAGWAAGSRHAARGERGDPVVRESLHRLGEQIHALDRERAGWQGQLHAQVEMLRRETSTLSLALRRPAVRGRWGELHLRRAVELAGLVDRCDFTEQLTLVGAPEDDEPRVRRPDLVVHLAGGKNVVVDSKVPLEAFFDAGASEDDDERAGHLRRHARHLRRHVDDLAGKAYWRSLPATPEFVVLFVPGEAFLSAALEADPSLLEDAAERRVVLATPTTLIALLRTVAYAWTQDALADRAREVHDLGRSLHQRLQTLTGHLDRLGRSLSAAVGSYNDAVGSYERRVLVAARRFSELDPGADELDSPAPVLRTPRACRDDETPEDAVR